MISPCPSLSTPSRNGAHDLRRGPVLERAARRQIWSVQRSQARPVGRPRACSGFHRRAAGRWLTSGTRHKAAPDDCRAPARCGRAYRDRDNRVSVDASLRPDAAQVHRTQAATEAITPTRMLTGERTRPLWACRVRVIKNPPKIASRISTIPTPRGSNAFSRRGALPGAWNVWKRS